MGLDITAFAKLVQVEDLDRADIIITQQMIDWSQQFGERCGDLKPGRYIATGEQYGFGAGSYSGYNDWRDELARLVGLNEAGDVFDPAVTGPFVELINFADNEGYIGAKVAAKLHKDFLDHRDKAKVQDTDRAWFYSKYERWMRAFELAADNGVVDFH